MRSLVFILLHLIALYFSPILLIFSISLHLIYYKLARKDCRGMETIVVNPEADVPGYNDGKTTLAEMKKKGMVK